MCGIAGLAVFGQRTSPPREVVEAMCRTMVHRGPDEAGLHVEDGAGLGMRRLSIIDVEGGHQPYFNEDRSVFAVYNGEIYNFRELRAELEGRGHRLGSNADGEVIVHLWEEVGDDLPRYLNGMFAIALYDTRTRRLALFRDHFGIKPLFYSRHKDHFYFGSTIAAIMEVGGADTCINPDAVVELLTWEYVPAPRTLLSGVSKLPPGHLLVADLSNGDVRVSRWWDVQPPAEPQPRTPGEWEEAIEAQVRTSVQRQLVSDVPLGAFLSGGVDSSLVVAMMGPDAQTFSIGFDDESYNELRWSRRVAAHLGVRHETEVVRPDALELFPKLMDHLDDPIGDVSIFPTFLVSRLARTAVTVALSGDGGDEVFGGYDTFVAERLANRWSRLPAWLRDRVLSPAIAALPPGRAKKGVVNKAQRFLQGLQLPEDLGHGRWRVFLDAAGRRRLLSADTLDALREDPFNHVRELLGRLPDATPVDRMLYADLHSYLSDNCLTKVDRMSMACSLEVRVPLLDPDLVSLAFGLPPELRVGDRGETKVLLKRVAARHVPRDCVYRQKEGFSIPMKHWLRGPFRPLLDDYLSASRLRRGGLFDAAEVERIRREHDSGRHNHAHLLWTLLVFESWRERWAP